MRPEAPNAGACCWPHPYLFLRQLRLGYPGHCNACPHKSPRHQYGAGRPTGFGDDGRCRSRQHPHRHGRRKSRPPFCDDTQHDMVRHRYGFRLSGQYLGDRMVLRFITGVAIGGVFGPCVALITVHWAPRIPGAGDSLHAQHLRHRRRRSVLRGPVLPQRPLPHSLYDRRYRPRGPAFWWLIPADNDPRFLKTHRSQTGGRKGCPQEKSSRAKSASGLFWALYCSAAAWAVSGAR